MTDAAGTLHAFDAFPAENLTNSLVSGSTNDDGLADFSLGASYDEIWNARVGSGASAPTVASFSGTNYVFVESRGGVVLAYNAVTGAPVTGASAPFTLSGNGDGAFPGSAPSPTVYEGRSMPGRWTENWTSTISTKTQAPP